MSGGPARHAPGGCRPVGRAHGHPGRGGHPIRALEPPAAAARPEGLDQALAVLAREMTENPRSMLQRLVETALHLCRADTAGLSLLEGDVFRWEAVAGAFASYRDGTMPRAASPCGVCIDRERDPAHAPAGSSLSGPAGGAAVRRGPAHSVPGSRPAGGDGVGREPHRCAEVRPGGRAGRPDARPVRGGGVAALERARGRRGGESPQGRVRGHGRPRAAESAGRDLQRGPHPAGGGHRGARHRGAGGGPAVPASRPGRPRSARPLPDRPGQAGAADRARRASIRGGRRRRDRAIADRAARTDAVGGAAGRADVAHGRRRPAVPDAVEPPGQRREVHAARRPDLGQRPDGRWPDRARPCGTPASAFPRTS